MSRIRSPNYPMLSLPEAIEKVAAIHKAEQHLAAPKVVIANALSYPKLHALAGRIISAIEKYGLLEEASGDKIKVSQLAISILHPVTPEEKRKAIQEAAYKPALFAAIKEEWQGERPSDANLRAYLIRNKYAADAVERVIQIYRETMDLVTQESGAYPTTEGGGSQPPPERQEKQPMQPARTAAFVSAHPGVEVSVSEPFRVSFTGNGIEVTGVLNSRERADELVGAINALKVLLRPAQEAKRTTGREGLEDILGPEE